MAGSQIIVLSLVERGWQAARELSLDLLEQRIFFVHVLKGYLDRSLRASIAPRPNTRILSLPRTLFWPAMSLLALGLFLTGRLRSILVDNERSVRRLRGWARLVHLPVTMIRQGTDGYELWMETEQVSRSTWCQRLLGRCG